MKKKFKNITEDRLSSLFTLRKEISAKNAGAASNTEGFVTNHALDKKTTELIRFSVNIVSQTEVSIKSQVLKLVTLGVSREEFIEVLSIVAYVGSLSSLLYAADALRLFEEFNNLYIF
jgi:alkylhydroperoxidase/carboxymuconolactone decarboxylase family protein YurZ